MEEIRAIILWGKASGLKATGRNWTGLERKIGFLRIAIEVRIVQGGLLLDLSFTLLPSAPWAPSPATTSGIFWGIGDMKNRKILCPSRHKISFHFSFHPPFPTVTAFRPVKPRQLNRFSFPQISFFSFPSPSGKNNLLREKTEPNSLPIHYTLTPPQQIRLHPVICRF